MGHSYFGNLAKIRGIVFYRLSPHELKPFHGILSHGVPNMVRRFRESVFRVAPPFFVTYIIMDWANAENDRLSRKDPKQFENDK